MLYQVIEDGEITQSYAMPDHDDTHHITSAKRETANGVAGIDDKKHLLPSAQAVLWGEYGDLIFVSGTCARPECIVDGSHGNCVGGTPTMTTNSYVIAKFSGVTYIDQFRHFANAANNGTGRFKIQHYANGAWVDNTSDIPVGTATDWTSWGALTTPVWTKKIKLVCTLQDAAQNKSYISQFAIKADDSWDA